MSDRAPSAQWGPVRATFVSGLEPPDELVANVHAVALLGDQVILVRGSEGWELPGGTREEGETVSETLRRELIEEIGGSVIAATALGFWRCQSSALRPYRPHIPHPEFAILVVAARVGALSPPTGWGNEEGHSAIMLASVDDAIGLLDESDTGRPHAGVLRRVRRELSPSVLRPRVARVHQTDLAPVHQTDLEGVPRTVVNKVVCYVVREGRLLVFTHLDHPMEVAGVQVPAGTVEPGETPAEAAIRETREETGVEAVILRELGTATYDLAPARDELAHRTFFLLEPWDHVRERWTAGESDPSTGGAGERWECWWMPLSQGHVLVAGLGALLGRI